MPKLTKDKTRINITIDSHVNTILDKRKKMIKKILKMHRFDDEIL